MGRPSKIDRAAAGRVIEATRGGATREAAAAAGPVARSTLYAWIREGRLDRNNGPAAKFVAELDAADDAAELACIDAWREHFPKDWRACAEFLARRFPQRWAPRREDEPERHIEAGVRISDGARAGAMIEDLRRWRVEHGLDPEPSGPDDGEPTPGPIVDREAGRAEMSRRGLPAS